MHFSETERKRVTEDFGEVDRVQIEQTLSEPVNDLYFYLEHKGRPLDGF